MEKFIPISDIRIDGGTQPRSEINEAVVAEYAEAMEEGVEFPPIVLYFDGAVYWLADGFHRYHATRRVGFTEIFSDVIEGSRRDAVLHSVGANNSHGLRRTNADKRKAVETLIKDEEWGKWSDREIARRCGVSDRFVNGVRGSLSANDSQIERKAERGGKEYTVNTANIGKPTPQTRQSNPIDPIAPDNEGATGIPTRDEPTPTIDDRSDETLPEVRQAEPARAPIHTPADVLADELKRMVRPRFLSMDAANRAKFCSWWGEWRAILSASINDQ